MSLADTPINPSATTIAGAYIPLVLPNGVEKKVTVSELLAVLSGDIDTSVANGDTIASRVNIAVGTTPTITLPSVSGTLRNVTVLNSASGNCTLDTPGSEKIFTGTADADTLVIATGKTATLWSDGTKFYHVSNDA